MGLLLLLIIAVTLALPMQSSAEGQQQSSAQQQITGCPSILQESLFNLSFYSKGLPPTAYYDFQYKICSLGMDSSTNDFVLPLDAGGLDIFIQSAQMLVLKWSSRLESIIRADPMLSDASIKVIFDQYICIYFPIRPIMFSLFVQYFQMHF